MGILDFLFGNAREIVILRNANRILIKENEGLNKEKAELMSQVFIMQNKINDLKKEIEGNPELEAEETKYPAIEGITYERKELDGNYLIDVRDFVSAWRDSSIPVVSGQTDDEIALNGLKWVKDNIKYTADSSEYANNEYWAFPYQTMKHKKGDCEDGAILLYCILRKSGIDYRKLRVSAGDTSYGGHCYLTYYDEERDRWVSLDWCLLSNNLAIKDRANYKDETYYGNIWFSFNEIHSFSKGTKAELKNIKFLKGENK